MLVAAIEITSCRYMKRGMVVMFLNFYRESDARVLTVKKLVNNESIILYFRIVIAVI